MKYQALLLLCFFLACKPNSDDKQTDTFSDIGPMCKPSVTDDKAWYTSDTKAPKLEGLQGVNFKISTQNSEVQDYFNQGMMLAYGFNHAEAARSFHEAGRLDSTCAMAFWGFAYVLGPNYNGGMEADNYERAYQAIQKASSLSASCTPKEKALITAMMSRYTAEAPEDRSSLDQAYAAEMKKVYDTYPDDPDIGAMYAESLMNLHPWDLYEKDSKKAKEWTPEIVAILHHLMEIHPFHPGAHHLYIHAMEASAMPESALTSAYLLDTLVPGSGHLVHMPSHIYINTGDYHLGSLSNMEAVKVDSIYTTACHAQGAYPLAYYPHNYHFLAATATLEGKAEWAWMAAEKLQKHTAKDLMDQEGWGTLQHYYVIPYNIAVKFDMWDKILAMERPKESLVYPNAILTYARGMAFLGKNDLVAAKAENMVLDSLSKNETLKDLTIWGINSTYDLVQIASKILSAEILAKENKGKEAIKLLQEAVVIEDRLNYNEPPDWFFSVRHHLGALQLVMKDYKNAEITYRKDLETWKKNGWALFGLHQALTGLKQTDEAQKVKASFDLAWKNADVSLASSAGLVH